MSNAEGRSNSTLGICHSAFLGHWWVIGGSLVGHWSFLHSLAIRNNRNNPNGFARFRRLSFLIPFPGLPSKRHRAKLTQVQDWNHWTERNLPPTPKCPELSWFVTGIPHHVPHPSRRCRASFRLFPPGLRPVFGRWVALLPRAY